MFGYYLRDLPPFAKVFTGIFTTLMIFVCLWAMLIFYVEKGMIEEGVVPAYLQDNAELNQEGRLDTPEEIAEDIEDIQADEKSELAPIWDSTFAGRPAEADSASMVEYMADKDTQLAVYEPETDEMGADDEEYEGPHGHLRHNVGLAHTHINGQTLLFFAIGLVFLFTSAAPKIKKTVYWVFGVSVLVHAIGLTGEGYFWLWDDLLAISGVALLVVILYMALLIYVDLGKKARRS